MKSSACLATTLLCALFLSGKAHSQTVPFDSDRWEIQAKESKVGDYLGRRSLYLKGGAVVVKDSQFTDGVIEFDIAFAAERGFTGAFWRMQDAENYEEFYIRPHQSGNPDANQYQPVFNGVAAWRQRFAGDDKDNRDFFDGFSFPGLVRAAYAEAWRR